MNQAKLRDKGWVEVEWRTDGIYANGLKIANPYCEVETDECLKLEVITL